MSVITLSPNAETKGPDSSIECRVWNRHSCHLLSNCQPVAARGDDEITWDGSVTDISEGGIGLVCVRRFEPGSGLAIQIPLQDDPDGETLLAKVVHVKRSDDGRWFLGCSFVSNLSDDHICQLLRQALTNPITNGTHQVEPVAGPFYDDLQKFEATKDRSNAMIPKVWWQNDATGVRHCIPQLYLNVNWPLKPKKAIRLWLSPENTDSKPTRLIVSDCTRQQDGWLVRFLFDGNADPLMQQLFG